VDNGRPLVPACASVVRVTVEIPRPLELTLGPATRLLWRSPESVHLELGGRSVVVEGLPAAVLRRVASPVAPKGPAPPLDESVRRALLSLAEAGYLWPRAAPPGPGGPRGRDEQRPGPEYPDGRQPEERDPRLVPPEPRLAGQLVALAAQHGGHAAAILGARRQATVEITGRSRLAAHLAAVLGAAGIGRIHCAVDGPTRLFHLVPGGAGAADEGTPLAVAAEAAVHRAAPEADTAPLPADERPDLTIIATEAPIPDERLDALHAEDAPYLAVLLGTDFGVVGPLVLPGLTSCLRCAELHRRDRDPAWSSLAVQLAIARRHGPAADVTVATTLAGVAAQQALTFLDGGDPATLDGTLELRLPDWRLRRRSWSTHPDCSCIAAGDGGG
jgi:hypothetical protein